MLEKEFRPVLSDTIRRNVLIALLNIGWSVADSLPHLNDLTKSEFWMDWRIAEKIRDSDIIPILNAMVNWPHAFDSLFPLHHLVDRTCCMAMNRIHEPEVIHLLATVIAVQVRNHSFRVNGESGFGKMFSTETEKRRLILLEIISTWDETDSYWFRFINEFGLHKDLGYLLEKITDVSARSRAIMSKLISTIATPETLPPYWDLFLERRNQVQELKDEFSSLRAYEIEGQDGRKLRAHYLRYQRLIQRRNRMRIQPSPREPRIANALLMIADGKYDFWIHLHQLLFLNENDNYDYSLTGSDVSRSYGWKSADKARREAIKMAARRFLLSRNLEIPCEPNRSTNYSDAAYAAIGLLRKEIRVDNELRNAVSNYCIPCVIWSHFNDAQDHSELVILAYSINPARCREAFDMELEASALQGEGYTLAARQFFICWDAELFMVARNFLLRKSRKPGTIHSLLEQLVERRIPFWCGRFGIK